MQDTSHNKDGDMYERLMAMSQEALVSAHYETAYHALAAAMHYAQALGDDQRLSLVEQAAKAQQDWIDAHAPAHRLSTQSAAKRRVVSIYNMLARQAATLVLIVQNEHRREHSSRLSWPEH